MITLKRPLTTVGSLISENTIFLGEIFITQMTFTWFSSTVLCSKAITDQFYGHNIYCTDLIQKASHCSVLSNVSQEYFYQQKKHLSNCSHVKDFSPLCVF